MINNDISLESIFNKLKQLQIKNEVICIILSWFLASPTMDEYLKNYCPNANIVNSEYHFKYKNMYKIIDQLSHNNTVQQSDENRFQQLLNSIKSHNYHFENRKREVLAGKIIPSSRMQRLTVVNFSNIII